MASGFFGLLAQGASFSGRADVADFKKKQKRAKSALTTTTRAPDDDELDFFGFNATAPPAEEEDKPAPRVRKISEDMIPRWAGNERKTPKGSKPRRKRKLSEGAIEEQKLEDEARKQASLLLTPKSNKAMRRRKRKERRRSRSESMGSEQSETHHSASSDEEEEQQKEEHDDSDHEEEEEEEEPSAVSLFKNSKETSAVAASDDAPSSSAKASRATEELALFRRQMGIRVDGSAVPAPIAEFAAMRVRKDQQKMKAVLLKNVEASEYKEPTPVQMQAIPSMLLGRDVLATAPTGSGKTAAFAIPMLANLAASSPATTGTTSGAGSGIRSVVLSPTRELAVQILGEFTRLSKGKKMHLTLLSKATAATIASQVNNKMSVHIDVLIATPLRLVHLIQETSLDLSSVEVVTLDEADRLFDMGFVEQIDEVLAACTNPSVQRTMFSATMLEGVEEMAQSVLRDPIKVAIGTKNAGASTIDQKLEFVGKEEGKLVAMKQLFRSGLQLPALLFVQNKERAQELYHELLYDGVSIGAVHADRTKEQRDETIRQFRTGEIWVLICTDLMSRGIDFKAVNMVINYDFPQSAVSYIHRIGRTGRGGRKGHAVTFFTEDDMVYLRSIANVMKLSGCDVPDWMLSIKKASMKKRKELLKAPPQRHRISTVSGYDLQKSNRLQQYKKRPGKPNSGDASASSNKERDQSKATPKTAGDAPEQQKKKRKSSHKKAKTADE